MVTMAVSTVSVIESVIVIRLCSLGATGTPMPSIVRLIAFRVIGRALLVSCPSTKVSPGPGRDSGGGRLSLPGDNSSAPGVKDRPLENVTAGAVKPPTAMDEVLAELRKVEL